MEGQDGVINQKAEVGRVSVVVCLPVILKVTKVTFMLKSENYGIH